MKQLIFAFAYGLISCNPIVPQDPVVVDPIDTIETNQYVELLWKKPITPDTLDVSNIIPIIAPNMVGLIHKYGGPTNMLTFRDALSGEQLWTWTKPDYFSGGESITNNTSLKYGDLQLITGWSKMAVVNLVSGKELWDFDTKEFGNFCGTVYKSMIGEFIYLSVYECNSKRTNRRMYRTSINHMSWELLYESINTDGWEGDLMPPTLYINPIGDSLLVFQDRMINFSLPHTDSRVDLVAFNLKNRKIEWKYEDIDPEGNSNIRPPTVYQDKVYFMGQRTVYCVTADSGKYVWKRQYPLDSDGAYGKHFGGQMNLPVYNNLLISHPNDQLMEALDPKTGIPIWIQSEKTSANVTRVAGDPYEMFLYKDYIIYSSQSHGGVCIHKLFNGELRYRLRSPSVKKSSGHDFNKPIAIDQELGLLYACDGWFWYCYKLKI